MCLFGERRAGEGCGLNREVDCSEKCRLFMETGKVITTIMIAHVPPSGDDETGFGPCLQLDCG